MKVRVQVLVQVLVLERGHVLVLEWGQALVVVGCEPVVCLRDQSHTAAGR